MDNAHFRRFFRYYDPSNFRYYYLIPFTYYITSQETDGTAKGLITIGLLSNASDGC